MRMEYSSTWCLIFIFFSLQIIGHTSFFWISLKFDFADRETFPSYIMWERLECLSESLQLIAGCPAGIFRDINQEFSVRFIDDFILLIIFPSLSVSLITNNSCFLHLKPRLCAHCALESDWRREKSLLDVMIGLVGPNPTAGWSLGRKMYNQQLLWCRFIEKHFPRGSRIPSFVDGYRHKENGGFAPLIL